MTTPETSREPCPDRILDDIGGAFGMGAVGGSGFHFLKSVYNSPANHRFKSGLDGIRMNGPKVGGSFAVWGGLFSACDCSMVYLRQKEDPWNSILSGAVTGGLLSLRQGMGPATRAAAFGGVLLALIEGGGIMLNKYAQQQADMSQIMSEEQQQPGPESVDSGSGWLSGFFKKEEVKEKVKTEILESFDSPMPPSFEYN